MMIEKETTQDLKMFETNIQAELKIKNERETSNYEIQKIKEKLFRQKESEIQQIKLNTELTLELKEAELKAKFIKELNHAKSTIREKEREKQSKIIFHLQDQHRIDLEDNSTSSPLDSLGFRVNAKLKQMEETEKGMLRSEILNLKNKLYKQSCERSGKENQENTRQNLNLKNIIKKNKSLIRNNMDRYSSTSKRLKSRCETKPSKKLQSATINKALSKGVMRRSKKREVGILSQIY